MAFVHASKVEGMEGRSRRRQKMHYDRQLCLEKVRRHEYRSHPPLTYQQRVLARDKKRNEELI